MSNAKMTNREEVSGIVDECVDEEHHPSLVRKNLPYIVKRFIRCLLELSKEELAMLVAPQTNEFDQEASARVAERRTPGLPTRSFVAVTIGRIEISGVIPVPSRQRFTTSITRSWSA